MKMFVSFSLALLVGLQSVALFAAEPNKKTLKSRAIAQLDESVKRFKKCLHGDCTKQEVMKVARDVTVAVGTAAAIAAGVAGAAYLAGKATDLYKDYSASSRQALIEKMYNESKNEQVELPDDVKTKIIEAALKKKDLEVMKFVQESFPYKYSSYVQIALTLHNKLMDAGVIK